MDSKNYELNTIKKSVFFINLATIWCFISLYFTSSACTYKSWQNQQSMYEDKNMQKVHLAKHQNQLSIFGEKMLKKQMLNVLEAFLMESIGTAENSSRCFIVWSIALYYFPIQWKEMCTDKSFAIHIKEY